MTLFTRSELEEFWATKPYGEFSRMVKSMKGKNKYRIKTTVVRIVEEVIGENEMIVLAKDYHDATNSVNTGRNVEALRLRFGFKSYDNKIRYLTKVVEQIK